MVVSVAASKIFRLQKMTLKSGLGDVQASRSLKVAPLDRIIIYDLLLVCHRTYSSILY